VHTWTARVLDGARLTGANLTNATLAHAHLIGADLSGADLDGADLSGAKLTNAALNLNNLCWAPLVDGHSVRPQAASPQGRSAFLSPHSHLRILT
jgi:uncharacterized protein YjbI with pentapeptide repeats